MMCPDKHHRGEYKALSMGVLFGNGQKVSSAPSVLFQFQPVSIGPRVPHDRSQPTPGQDPSKQ